MKKIYTLFIALACLFWSCDSKLDIVPKGKTTLANLTDIELLLNQEFSFGGAPAADLGIICNDAFTPFGDVAEYLATPNTLNYAYLTYDESIDRASLVNDDSRYKALYKQINNMNVVIEKTGDVEGDTGVKTRLISEAKILRAYFHYLLVNIYAKQYDETTASSLGGVPYVDKNDVGELKKKLTIAEVYEHLLEDCSEDVISNVKDYVDDLCRVDKAFAWGVRAKVFFQMKRYGEAAEAARQAIRYNNNLEDRSEVKTTGVWDLRRTAVNNYMYMYGGTPACPTYVCMPTESVAFFDENDYVRKYEIDSWTGGPTWSAEDAEMYCSYEGALNYTGWGTMYNNMGIRTENMYYIIGESLIRQGNIKEGLGWFDQVRAKRIENPEIWANKALDEAGAMELVRQFSYIEFICGYDTFFNCKRWNSESAYARTITRDLGKYGKYSISPDSPLWVFPFPSSATRYNETLTQNY